MDLYLAMLSSMPVSERKMVCLRGYNNQLLMNVSIIIMQRKPLWIAPTTVYQWIESDKSLIMTMLQHVSVSVS